MTEANDTVITSTFLQTPAIFQRPEITRFKGLGEISPDEFGPFIGSSMRLELVTIEQSSSIFEMLNYYMGKNTGERQNFIIENLRSEELEA